MLNPKNLKPGQEQHDTFIPVTCRKGVKKVQYDYRSLSGELFSCVGKNLEYCQELRKIWQAGKFTKSDPEDAISVGGR